MTLALTIGVVGGGMEPFRTPFPDEALEKPYAERLKVELTADEGESLGSVLERACRELGVTVEGWGFDSVLDAIWRVGFYLPEDDERLLESRLLFPQDMTVLDEKGRVTWSNDMRHVTMS
jgi:hypothetical protein